MPPKHISDALDILLMVAADGVLTLWTTGSHRLFHCPRFEFLRQQLRSEIEADTGGTQTWEWDFLTGLGRRYLSRFLRVVHSIPLPHGEDEDE